ncbi:MAG: hypothetical protein JXJ19_01440 [Elusimicrobia bacterium]|nr:hypothetical protein [Elusimicrobiota bacterium]
MKEAYSPVKGYLHRAARPVLLSTASFWFVFALFSGSPEKGSGLKGVILNSPNSFPWMMLIAVIILSKRYPRICGLLILAMGIASVFFFRTYRYIPVLFLVSIPLLVFGPVIALGAGK